MSLTPTPYFHLRTLLFHSACGFALSLHAPIGKYLCPLWPAPDQPFRNPQRSAGVRSGGLERRAVVRADRQEALAVDVRELPHHRGGPLHHPPRRLRHGSAQDRAQRQRQGAPIPPSRRVPKPPLSLRSILAHFLARRTVLGSSARQPAPQAPCGTAPTPGGWSHTYGRIRAVPESVA